VLTVADIDRTVDFYTRAMGMTAERFRVEDGSERTALRFGGQKINLHQQGREFEPKAERPTPGSGDLCFLTENDLGQWQAKLADLGIPILEGPVERAGAVSPILSIYFRDPDGNLFEVAVRR